VGEYVLNGTEPKGYVADATADWLIARLDHDGRLDSQAELELLVRVLEKALGTPDSLKAYALAQIERAVLTGGGPTRSGGTLDAGSITEAECKLVRRVIFASGGDRPAAVSKAEAEMLFRLKDATLGQPNAADWQRLFVQGVGNYLQGWNNARSVTRERAAELESFMAETSTGLSRFFGRMARTDAAALRTAARDVMVGSQPPTRDFAAEASAEAAVTGAEHSWLQSRIDADGHSDPLEEALLAFLAEE